MGSVIRRALLAVVMVSAGLVVAGAGAGPAYGCSCRAGVAVDEKLAQSDAAFVGVLKGRDDPDGAGPIVSSGRRVVNHFDVERIVKGDIGATVEVEAAAGGASCGLELAAGTRTGLFLRRSEAGRWTSSLCSQVAANELLASAPGGGVAPGPAPGGGVAPAPAPGGGPADGAGVPAVAAGAGEEGGDGGGRADWRLILLAGLLVLAVPVAIVLGGAHRRAR